MDDLTSLLDPLGSYTGSSFDGSSSPNSNALPLSTPVNTSGNTNNSGSWFSSFISGLGQATTTAANAYNSIMGKPATTKTATTSATMMPILLIGGGILLLIVVLMLLFRK